MKKTWALIISCCLIFGFFLCNCSDKKTVFIVGDSLLLGYKIEEKESALSIIKNKLHNCVHYCEIGLTISAFAAILDRYDIDSISCVIIELGANDFLLGRDSAKTCESFLSTINYFKKKGIPVCIISFIDKTMFQYKDLGNVKLLEDYDKMYESLLEQSISLITNIWEGNFSNMDYKVDDFHPNAEGAKVIARHILREIKKMGFLR
ncbi:MAG: hypothetical protein IJT36_01100 [Alphaproteobacteria bacterium]|nr:hypothetical protein [Treponema sp.]MBQ7673117.1 hypothetical protein [Alphaproteobacteria bacterium]